MNSFDPLASSRMHRHFEQASDTQDDRVHAYIARQEHKISELKSTYNQLRNKLSDVERNYKLELIRVQGQLGAIRRRRKELEKRRDDIKASQSDAERQKIARELIEQIWSTLTTYRRQLFSQHDTLYNNYTDPESSPLTEPHFPEIPEPIDVRTSIPLEDITDSDCDVSVPLPETPTLDPAPRTVVDTPTVSATPAPHTSSYVEYESIASRRTRRSSTTNVYYREPSLRAALTPGDPYTFSLDSGIITPTVPDGYTRETPASRGSRTRKRK